MANGILEKMRGMYFRIADVVDDMRYGSAPKKGYLHSGHKAKPELTIDEMFELIEKQRGY